MIKEKRSWSKPNIPNLVARKKVDWSIFVYGTHIPIEFHEDFELVNGIHIERGEKHDLKLIIDDLVFEATLFNIKRQNLDIDTLQIRYDTNTELKNYLIKKLQKSFLFLKENRAQDGKEHVKVPDDIVEFIDFYETGEPFVYKIKIINNMSKRHNPKVWWVNQGTSLNEEKEEGIIWAPLKASNGRLQYHWETLAEVDIGDIILHYANGAIRYISEVVSESIEAQKPQSLNNTSWDRIGRLIKVNYFELNEIIKLDVFSREILNLNIQQGPIDIKGNVKQGYLFRFTVEGLSVIQNLKPNVNWPMFTQFEKNLNERNFDSDKKNQAITSPQKLLNSIYEYIENRGFSYEKNDLINFFLSLKAKPFVILAGISGTGKSKLVELFANAVGANVENGQFTIIPVRPDWNDSSDLLGYKNINGEFKSGPLTGVIKKAYDNQENPYFVCLDEMNLSRVEYYFSDFLSLMETKKKTTNGIFSEPIFHEYYFENDKDEQQFSNLRMPPNLYIIGTVNMDETTYPFSKKVLDRANTIEFSKVNLSLLPEKSTNYINAISINNNLFQSNFLSIVDCLNQKEYVLTVISKLDEINNVLAKSNLHVGYRVRDEISFYMVYNNKYELMDEDDAFDFQFMQKILPRIQGSSNLIFNTLVELFKIASGQDLTRESNVSEKALNYVQANEQIKPYPRSANKIATMLWRFDDGFTSYWL